MAASVPKEEDGVAIDTSKEVIAITIQVVDGDEDLFHFNDDQLVGSAKQRVLNRFHIVPPPGVIYYFAFAKGKLLDDNKSWEQNGVKSGMTILFGTEQQVG